MVFSMEQETYANEPLTIQEVQGVQEIQEVQGVATPRLDKEAVKNHRFSALVNGFCMGAGFVFLVAGIIMPLLMPQQLVVGLSLVIGSILCLSLGTILEVYQLAKLR